MAVTRLLELTVNGRLYRSQVEPRRLLVHCLRNDLGLTGTHIGCETSQCGACVVILDGRAVKSCTVLAVQAHRGSVLTIEGLAQGQHLHALQQAFWEQHGLQCGFCTPGMIMCAYDILTRQPHPSEEDIRRALHGNLCRCTGYQNIVAAIQRASEQMDARQSAAQNVGLPHGIDLSEPRR